jgi:uncharacterized repeat protein (TIGR02543 family)
MKKSLLILLVALMALTLVVGCKKEPKVTGWTVTFDTDGGSKVDSQIIEKGGGLAKKPDNPTKDGYYFVAWNTEDDEKFDFETTITADITLKAVWKPVYTVGTLVESEGGWVFYDVDADNDTGNADNLKSSDCGWRYLVAAKSDISGFTWGDTGDSKATGTAVGTGKDNTKAMFDNLSTSVAQQVWGKTIDGHSDWFIPSSGELQQIKKELYSKNKGTWAGKYWSSTADGTDNAYLLQFSYGSPVSMKRSMSGNAVRPVRAI